MKKLTAGMIIFGVLLILGGLSKQFSVFGLIGSFLSPRITEQDLARHPSAEAASDESRAAVVEYHRRQTEFSASLLTRFYLLANILLGWAALAGGIGLFMTAPWAREMILSYAYVSLPIQLFQQVRGAVLTVSMMQAAAGAMPNQPAMAGSIFGGIGWAMGLLGILTVCLWYGLLIWYFRRPVIQARLAGGPGGGTLGV